LEEPSVERFKSEEDRKVAYASYLEEMFEKDFSLMMKFVEAHPKLDRAELAEKWIEENL